MPSLRSHLCRFLTNKLVAPRFKTDISINEARKGMENLTRFSKLPTNTKVVKVSLNGCVAEWVYQSAATTNSAILYLHGGAYNLCSINTHRELAARIAEASATRVLIVDYRLAPEHPFPCALEDALAAYRWLLTQGLPCDRISIGGDSAGGGLALATAISLRDSGDPLPASIVCISPWADLALTGASIQSKCEIDPMLNPQWLRSMAANYTVDNDPRSPLISPLYASLENLPPILIQVGTDEILLDDSKRIAESAQKIGSNVTLEIYDQLWHVFHLNAKFMPEAKMAIEKIGAFIKENFDNRSLSG